ncbi:hypothetical protein DPMN_002482 [Dreissena polymorpha]|uniref:Uncharacterized protein n=1 Tax=Dreissena polymorpha TaxID=45954 RepID=A0A9D4MJS4_DREPO|nr:hypothetical protein DPMN_002482 [Dreissena polymorpha]
MSVKAVSRAVRGNLLVDAALSAMVTAETYGTTPQQTATCERNDTDKADSIQAANPQKEPPSDVLFETDEHRFQELDVVIRNYDDNDLDTISAIYDQLLRKQISPESLLTHPVIEKVKSKYDNTLQDLKQYPTATGHNLYLKSAYMYLQKMDDLQDTHPTCMTS